MGGGVYIPQDILFCKVISWCWGEGHAYIYNVRVHMTTARYRIMIEAKTLNNISSSVYCYLPMSDFHLQIEKYWHVY